MTSKQTKVLFFGQKRCHYSQQVAEYLKHLDFEVEVVWSENRKEKLPKEIFNWSGDYIFCFRSYFVLPKSIIDKAAIAAINFHPAPVEYPGSGCLNWALYENAKNYGVTAHIMNELVDNGAIVECRRFPILPQDNVKTLLAKAHLKTFDLIIDIATGIQLEGVSFLKKKIETSKSEQWKGQARKMKEIDELQNISISCSKEELERIIRSTYTTDFPPIINLHGYQFFLRLEP